MVRVKFERMKNDIRNALCEVFKRRGLSHVVFTKIYLSSDHSYTRVEIDSITENVDTVVLKLNEKHLHSEIVKDLHKYLGCSFPKIVFAKDSHKSRINSADEVFKKLSRLPK